MENFFVKVLDRRGRVLWVSGFDRSRWDRPIFDYADTEFRELVEDAFSRCVIHGTSTQFVARWSCPVWKAEGWLRSTFFPVNPESGIATASAIIVQSVLRDNHPDFSDADKRLLELLASDKTVKEIAVELNRSESAIDARLRKLKTKLGVSTLHGLAAAAARSHLIPMPVEGFVREAG